MSGGRPLQRLLAVADYVDSVAEALEHPDGDLLVDDVVLDHEKVHGPTRPSWRRVIKSADVSVSGC